jgi:serine/threonine protein phosphatase PrpC
LLGAALTVPFLGRIQRAEADKTGVALKRTAEDMVGTLALSYQGRVAGELDALERGLHGISELVSRFGDSIGSPAEYEIAARFLSEAKRCGEAMREEDLALSEKITEYISDGRLKHGTARAFGERRKYIIIAGEDKDGEVMTSPEFLHGLAEASGVKLGLPEYYRRESIALMVVGSAPAYTLQSAIVSSAGDSGEASGDFADGKTCGDNTAYALVADGMGSGDDAGAVAGFCCEFISNILGTGVGIDTIFHALNSIIGKRTEECSVAIDLFFLDLITGEAAFIKSGATFSYIKRGSSLFRLRSATMPLGVIKQVDAEKISAKVEAGDIIIMFSDGICDGADDAPWLVELLNRSGGGDLKGLAEAILAAAKEHAAYKDDMTVVVSKVGSV